MELLAIGGLDLGQNDAVLAVFRPQTHFRRGGNGFTGLQTGFRRGGNGFAGLQMGFWHGGKGFAGLQMGIRRGGKGFAGLQTGIRRGGMGFAGRCERSGQALNVVKDFSPSFICAERTEVLDYNQSYADLAFRR
jgi:hypothetical protein